MHILRLCPIMVTLLPEYCEVNEKAPSDLNKSEHYSLDSRLRGNDVSTSCLAFPRRRESRIFCKYSIYPDLLRY